MAEIVFKRGQQATGGTGNISGTLTPTYVPYASAANTISDSNIYYDAVNGRVGIGTSTPVRKFEVIAGNAQIRISDGTPGSFWEFFSVYANTDQDLFIRNQNTNAIVINGSGRVGIGTTAPSEKLDVYGKIAINTTGSQSTTISNYYYSGTAGSNIYIGGGGVNTAPSTGYQASFNTAIGINSLLGNTTGQENTAIGTSSMYSNTTGIWNTSIGSESFFNNTVGSNNIAIGRKSLNTNISGNNNVAIGLNSLFNNNANNNTAIGYQSLYNNTSGTENTATGYNSLFSVTTGSYNTAYGTISMSNTVNGNENTAIGYGSLLLNISGNYNTALGLYALRNNTASHNTAVGHFALFGNGTGNFNTAIGKSSLQSNNADDNTAIGYQSMILNTTGVRNVAIGSTALSTNSTGSFNTAIGYSCLINVNNDRNTAIGYGALNNLTTGQNNTSIGMFSAANDGSGNPIQNNVNGVFIGYNVKPLIDNTDNEIVIGYNAKGNGTNTATLGANTITKTYLQGQTSVSAPTIVASAQLQVDSPNSNTGFLCPRMEDAQIRAIVAPAEGLMIYNTTISHICFYMAGAWEKINHSPM